MKIKTVLTLLLCFIPITAHAAPVTSQYMVDNIMSTSIGGTVFTLSDRRAVANVAASQTDSVVIAAVAGKVLRVTSVTMLAGATATNVTFNSKGAGAGTAISPIFANGANGGAVLSFNPVGWFETNSGEGLTVTTGAGSATGILVTYVSY